MTNLCKEYDKFLSENDERFKELSKENQFYMNAIGYGVKYYDLNRRIEKAIEYIEKKTEKVKYKEIGITENRLYLIHNQVDYLLDILKGSDKE